MNTIETASTKSKLGDFTDEGPNCNLKDETATNACLNQIKPLVSGYKKFVFVFSLDSAHKIMRNMPTSMFIPTKSLC